MDWSNLQRDYERLGSFAAVAEEYGVSRSWVSQKLKQQGWKRKIDFRDLPDLYAQGMTYQQLAEHYGCSMSTVASVAKRMGVVARMTGSTGYRWTEAQRVKHRDAVERGCYKDTKREHFRRLGKTAPKVNSPSERLLHQALIKAQLSFETQRQELGLYFPDVRLHQQPILIEVDGWAHNMASRREHDQRRDAALEAAGFRIFRFTDTQIETDADACVQHIINTCGLVVEGEPVAIIRDRRLYLRSA